MDWILTRLTERTTWLGLTTLLTTAGVAVSPELSNAIALLGISIGGFILVITKEHKK